MMTSTYIAPVPAKPLPVRQVATLLTTEEVAEVLRVSTRQVTRLARGGRIPGARRLPGLGWRFRSEMLAAWVA